MVRRLVVPWVLGLVTTVGAGCGARDSGYLGFGGQSQDTASGGQAGAGGAGNAGGVGGSGNAGAGGQAGAPPDILELLEAVAGAVVVEEDSEVFGYRFFRIELQQPADHDDPGGLWFGQRLALLHHDVDAPLVLASTGYALDAPSWSWAQYLEEPAQLLDANQLMVEHRFFAPSRPEPADWKLLNVAQAAADHHRIVAAFAPIYPQAWLSTGASKGGMTSVYHRRFYPEDVDGTVAYVAPHSTGPDDTRYLDFLAAVGDEACRKALRDFQREVLLRRPAMLARMAAQADDQGLSYDLVGIEPTFESVVVGFVFGFWQYFGADRCGDIPDASASDDAIWSFFDEIGAPASSSDEWVLFFEPYYWQAETELGYPASDDSHLADLLLYDPDSIDWTPSIALEPVFDPASMPDVSAWLATAGQRLLFVYGETDPWSAGAFALGAAEDSYRLYAPAANHGAQIALLSPADQQVALAALAAWTGVTPSPARGPGGPDVKVPPRLLRLLGPGGGVRPVRARRHAAPAARPE